MDVPPDLPRRPLARRWLPRSFYARAALILTLPIVTLQLAVAVLFLQRHYEDVTIRMTTVLAREIALVRADPGVADALGIELAPPPDRTRIAALDLSARTMRAVLVERVPDVAAIDASGEDRRIRVGFVDGTGLSVARSAVSTSNPHQLLVWMFAVALLMTGLSFWFMRGQIQPIRRLAQAAEAFGRGQPVAYRPSGPSEVRAAGMAFLDMRGRIERHIEQRTLLLSGVSHDLRTPLTRMKLELSMMDAPEAADLTRDVEAMERIIATFLDFSRESATDVRAPVHVAALLARAAAAASPDRPVAVTGGDFEARLYPDGMARAVGNLVANAARYGARIRVDVQRSDATLVIAVEDDGPGIPEARRGDAVRPFTRLDAARSNTAGNVGLGLSIVRDVARAHGGSLRLGESEMGGLKAEIVLPRGRADAPDARPAAEGVVGPAGLEPATKAL